MLRTTLVNFFNYSPLFLLSISTCFTLKNGFVLFSFAMRIFNFRVLNCVVTSILENGANDPRSAQSHQLISIHLKTPLQRKHSIMLAIYSPLTSCSNIIKSFVHQQPQKKKKKTKNN